MENPIKEITEPGELRRIFNDLSGIRPYNRSESAYRYEPDHNYYNLRYRLADVSSLVKKLPPGELIGVLFVNVQLPGVIADGKWFMNCIFEQCSLRGAGLRDTDFTNCIFSYVDFSGSVLTGARFTNCKFLNCEFDNAFMDKVILNQSGFINCGLQVAAADNNVLDVFEAVEKARIATLRK